MRYRRYSTANCPRLYASGDDVQVCFTIIDIEPRLPTAYLCRYGRAKLHDVGRLVSPPLAHALSYSTIIFDEFSQWFVRGEVRSFTLYTGDTYIPTNEPIYVGGVELYTTHWILPAYIVNYL